MKKFNFVFIVFIVILFSSCVSSNKGNETVYKTVDIPNFGTINFLCFQSISSWEDSFNMPYNYYDHEKDCSQNLAQSVKDFMTENNYEIIMCDFTKVNPAPEWEGWWLLYRKEGNNYFETMLK